VSEWLPQLEKLSDYGGIWERYVNALYGVFERDFVHSAPLFEGRTVRLKRHPMHDGKEATFWHLISEGEVEADRVPDLRRCERMGWPCAMIQAVGTDKVVFWRNKRKGERRIVISLPDFSYIVVLAERNGYVVLWTAYCVEQEHRRKKLESEYQFSIKY